MRTNSGRSKRIAEAKAAQQLRVEDPVEYAKRFWDTPPKVRIEHGAWVNALESPPFGAGKYTWGLTVTFPFKILKDEKMKRFMEEIQRAAERTIFQ